MCERDPERVHVCFKHTSLTFHKEFFTNVAVRLSVEITLSKLANIPMTIFASISTKITKKYLFTFGGSVEICPEIILSSSPPPAPLRNTYFYLEWSLIGLCRFFKVLKIYVCHYKSIMRPMYSAVFTIALTCTKVLHFLCICPFFLSKVFLLADRFFVWFLVSYHPPSLSFLSFFLFFFNFWETTLSISRHFKFLNCELLGGLQFGPKMTPTGFSWPVFICTIWFYFLRTLCIWTVINNTEP